MPIAGPGRELGRRRELHVGDLVLLERQRDEAEDVVMEGGDDEVPVGEGKLEPLRGQPVRLIGPALVGRDKGDTTQTPRGHEVRAFAVVALHGRLGDLTGLGQPAPEAEEPGQLDEVERIVPAHAGLGPDELLGHLDRQVEPIREPGEAEGHAVGVLPLPGAAVGADQRDAAVDLVRVHRLHELELQRGAQEDRVGEEVVVRVGSQAVEQLHRLVDGRESARDVELAAQERQPHEDPGTRVRDRSRPPTTPARRVRSRRTGDRGSTR